ncbi:hypothetical protein BGZ73_006714 [Actinomortierella ambigua]|nr:hypothetical protein BGZ73_006714 [Actinomortierella ambigua]
MSTSPAREGGASSPTVGSPRLAPSLGDHLGGSGSAGATGSPPSNTAATTGSATMTTTTTTTNTTTTTTTTNATSAATVSSSNSSISPSSSGILSGSGITVVAGSQHSGSSGLLGTSSNTTSATSIVTSTAGKGTILSSATSALGLGSSGVSDIKLKKYLEHNQRLREQLEMGRISVSEASKGLIKYVTTTKDALIPSLWGMPASDPFSKKSSGCCTIS